MKKTGIILSMFRRLKTFLIIDVVLFIIIGLICWFTHYRTLEYYSNGLLIAGIVFWGIGSLSLMGGSTGRQDFSYQYLRSGNQDQKVRQDAEEMNQSFSFLMRMMIIGVLPIACGVLLKITI